MLGGKFWNVNQLIAPEAEDIAADLKPARLKPSGN
jgi:hypothetical protein